MRTVAEFERGMIASCRPEGSALAKKAKKYKGKQKIKKFISKASIYFRPVRARSTNQLSYVIAAGLKYFV